MPAVGGAGIAPRPLTIYLPPFRDPDEEHALLIALDGQTMPGWRLGETLAELSLKEQIMPTIIVAVPASTHRLDEYGLADEVDYRGRGAKAAAFQAYLLETVLPRVRQRLVVTSNPARTGIFGASMGGLCAFDTAWNRPDVFGVAGVFSGALWWRSDNSTPDAQQTSRILHRRVRASRRGPALRLWFQAGTKDETDDRDGNGVIDAIQDTTELMDALSTRGYRRGADMHYEEVKGGEHNEATWARALPDFLRWALPRR
jgi:enterochelin esterase-like enzyme